jgi:hypothetical protein
MGHRLPSVQILDAFDPRPTTISGMMPRRKGFDSNKNAMKDRNLRDKIAAFDAYGGMECACCHEKSWRMLTIDHINGDGNAERLREFNNKYQCGHEMYRSLRRRGFPPGYQVLCMNCNFGRRMNNGMCPHKVPSPALRELLAELEKFRTGGARSLPQHGALTPPGITRLRRKAPSRSIAFENDIH